MKNIACVTVSSCALITALGVAPAKAQETAGSAPPANSQAAASAPSTGVQEIVVTAQKRGENLQDVPIAITAITAESLQAKGVTSVLELTQSTPAVYAAPYGVSSSILSFFMRGMGVGDPGKITSDPAIGVYENGIVNPRAVPFVFDLLDPERVEVLRGPQGTLYGRNTTGGAMNIVSRAPTGVAELRQLASYASRNQYRRVTNLDSPAIGNINLKGTLAIGGDDGYGKNVYDPSVPNSNHDFNMERHIAGRVAARWQPSSNFTADYSFSLGRQRSTPQLLHNPSNDGIDVVPGVIPTYRFIRDRSPRPVNLPWSQVNIRDHGLTLEWNPSDALTLRSITGIRYFNSNLYTDTLEAYWADLGAGPAPLPLQVFYRTKENLLTQEVQAIGRAWDDRIKYALGLYYYREKADNRSTYTYFFASTSETNTDLRSVSKAAYAQVTLTPPILDDRLDLTVGLRQTWDSKTASREQASGFTLGGPGAFPEEVPGPAGVRERANLKSNRFNPAATIAYRWTDDINSYVKVSTGYRAGGFNEGLPEGSFARPFQPETLTSYEAGLKMDLWDRRIRANFAAFYNQYKDIQLALEEALLVIPIVNAGKAHIEGVEADVTIAPFADLTINLNYSYLHSKITEVRRNPTAPNIADQFVIPFAPRHALAVSGDLVLVHSDQGPLSIHVDYNYKSKSYGTSGAGRAIPGREEYALSARNDVNARLSLGRNWFQQPAQISVFVKNLFDNRYKQLVTANGGQNLTSGYFAQNFALNPPRTIGVELSFALK